MTEKSDTTVGADEKVAQDVVLDSGGDSTEDVLRRLGPAAWLGLMWIALPIVGMVLLARNMDAATGWLEAQGTMAPVLFIGLFAVTAGLGVMPTWIQAVLAGFLFTGSLGSPGAVGVAMGGILGAAIIGRVIAAGVSGQRVEQEISRHQKLGVVRDALLNSGGWKRLGIVTLIRVPPNSPFALTNLVLGTAGVPWLAYVVGTGVGILPRTAAAVFIGGGLEEMMNPDKPRWLIFAGLASVVIVIVVIGMIANKAVKRVTGVGNEPDTSNEAS